jgi:hypothetical protein
MWLSRLLLKHGFVQVAAWADAVQPRVLASIFEAIVAVQAPGIVSFVERKAFVAAMIRVCCQTPEMVATEYIGAWAKLVGATVMVLSEANIGLSAASPESGDDDVCAATPEVSGVGTTFSQLSFATRSDTDALLFKEAGIREGIDFKAAFTQTLTGLSRANPGRL